MLVAKTLVPLPHYVVELVKSKTLHTEYLDMDCFPETIFSTIVNAQFFALCTKGMAAAAEDECY